MGTNPRSKSYDALSFHSTSRIPENSSFSDRHGRLLSLVNTNIEEDMMKVLFQFFDPLHHCFTFPDYQLVPTLEEFSQLLRIPILNKLPFNGTEKEPKPEDVARALHLQPSDVKGHWETRSGVKGFLAKCSGSSDITDTGTGVELLLHSKHIHVCPIVPWDSVIRWEN